MEPNPTQRQLRRFVRLFESEPETPIEVLSKIALGMSELELDDYLRRIHQFFISKLPRKQLATFNDVCRLANREGLSISTPIALG